MGLKRFIKSGAVIAVVFLGLYSCGGGGGDSGSGGGGTRLRKSNFTEKVGDATLEMVFVKGGTFVMGCTPEQGNECNGNEKPLHSVTVGDFHIGKHEVTQKLWKSVMGEDNNPSNSKGDNLPVEEVSWYDAQSFITLLNAKTGKNYRLPTEAEWEYAARGGNQSKGYKYSGSNNIDDVAWYDENRGGRTQPVGTKQPNELGIYDMSGNVCEWVNDWYGNYTHEAKIDPTGPSSGSSRVFRGGSWFGGAWHARVSYRFSDIPDFRDNDLGFRLAVSVSP